jgi:hypothetical protein
MRHPIPALIIALLISGAFVLTSSGCPKTGPANKKANTGVPAAGELTQRVFDERYGVTIMAPPDWTAARKNTNPLLFITAPGAGSDGPMANLVVEGLSQRMTPYDYLQANIITMRISLPELTVVTGGVELSDPNSPAWILYTYPRGKVKVEALTYCQTRDYRAFVITMIAPADKFPAYEPLFRAMGRSLRVQ